MKEYRRLKEKVLESMRCSFGEQDRKVWSARCPSSANVLHVVFTVNVIKNLL